MRVAFPINEDRGLDSPIHDHFGAAKFFLIARTDEDGVETVSNTELGHEHGQCQPMSALGGRDVEAVVVGRIGAGALRKIQAGGIRAYRGVAGSVADNLSLVKAGKLPEFIMTQTCSGRDCSHH